MNIQHPTSSIQHRGRRNAAFSAFEVRLLGILFLLAVIPAYAQPTNAPASRDYASFGVISDRNIFNPNRTGRFRAARTESRRVRVDSVSLVGTMAYEKGSFAFFDGSSADHKKVARVGDTITAYKVMAIEPNSVTLELDGKSVEMRVGAQMRREDGGSWRLSEESTAAAPASPDSTPAADEAPPAASGEANEVLRRLMEKREQESK